MYSYVTKELRVEIEALLVRMSTFFDDAAEMNHCGLMKGNAGIALFFAYYTRLTQNERHYHTAMGFLEKSLEAISSLNQANGLGGGFCGPAWLIKHLIRLDLLTSDSVAALEDIEPYIIDALSIQLEVGNYDLLYGFIGSAIYLLEEDNPGNHQYYEQILQWFSNNKKITGNGEVWWEDWQPGIQHKANLGLAHGIPGIVNFLIYLDKHYPTDTTKDLIRNAIAWVLSKETQRGLTSFPAMASGEGPETDMAESRLAWCYGDLGIVSMLYNAAVGLNEPAYVCKAGLVMRKVAVRRLHNSKVMWDKTLDYHDPCFCHGTSGILYQFNRILQYNNDPEILTAADYWLKATIANTNKMLDHFSELEMSKEIVADETIILNHFGVLTGLAGIGLTLINCIRPDLNKWDSILLLNQPGS
ncbi:lanthionine synthetase C family protein [Chitinophaga flava]|nr:lanthionine synthetase C family protein [Chitinophaga flava]